MELNEMEKRVLYQTEGSEWYAVLYTSGGHLYYDRSRDMDCTR